MAQGVVDRPAGRGQEVTILGIVHYLLACEFGYAGLHVGDDLVGVTTL